MTIFFQAVGWHWNKLGQWNELIVACKSKTTTCFDLMKQLSFENEIIQSLSQEDNNPYLHMGKLIWKFCRRNYRGRHTHKWASKSTGDIFSCFRLLWADRCSFSTDEYCRGFAFLCKSENEWRFWQSDIGGICRWSHGTCWTHIRRPNNREAPQYLSFLLWFTQVHEYIVYRTLCGTVGYMIIYF